MDKITIGNKLLDHGFNPANKGFGYLIKAVTIYKSGMPMAFVYNSVSEMCDCTPSSAERCIRHAKEKTEAFKHLDNRELIARIRWNLESEEAKKVTAK